MIWERGLGKWMYLERRHHFKTTAACEGDLPGLGAITTPLVTTAWRRTTITIRLTSDKGPVMSLMPRPTSNADAPLVSARKRAVWLSIFMNDCEDAKKDVDHRGPKAWRDCPSPLTPPHWQTRCMSPPHFRTFKDITHFLMATNDRQGPPSTRTGFGRWSVKSR